MVGLAAAVGRRRRARPGRRPRRMCRRRAHGRQVRAALARAAAPRRRARPGGARRALGGGHGTVTSMLDAQLGAPVVAADVLHDRIKELGAQITADYAGRAPLLVGVLKGAFMFMSDLSRAIDLPVEFDFMAVSSYGSATRSSGVVRIIKDLDLDLTDRHVLIVEDIVDSGLTLGYLRRTLAAREPASLEVCTLLLKEEQQKSDPDLKYVGFSIPPTFVVGYGLDVAERYRNLDHIAEYLTP